jgi:hypothetical protein
LHAPRLPACSTAPPPWWWHACCLCECTDDFHVTIVMCMYVNEVLDRSTALVTTCMLFVWVYRWFPRHDRYVHVCQWSARPLPRPGDDMHAVCMVQGRFYASVCMWCVKKSPAVENVEGWFMHVCKCTQMIYACLGECGAWLKYYTISSRALCKGYFFYFPYLLSISTEAWFSRLTLFQQQCTLHVPILKFFNYSLPDTLFCFPYSSFFQGFHSLLVTLFISPAHYSPKGSTHACAYYGIAMLTSALNTPARMCCSTPP